MFASLLPGDNLTVIFKGFILSTLFSFVVIGLAPSLKTLTPVISWFRWLSVPRYAYVNLLIAEYDRLSNF